MAPRVPTGMNTGVRISPRAVRTTPGRAAPSVASTSMPSLIAGSSVGRSARRSDSPDSVAPAAWRRRRRGTGSRARPRCAYSSRQRGPTNASIIASSDDRGRWKLVIITSTTLNRKPGVMNSRVRPDSRPSVAADSSARTVVVPTATTRRPSARVARRRPRSSTGTEYCSEWISCVLDAVRADRPERVQSHHQLHASRPATPRPRQLRRAPPGSGAARRSAPRPTQDARREHGLVALRVLEALVDVGRQRRHTRPSSAAQQLAVVDRTHQAATVAAAPRRSRRRGRPTSAAHDSARRASLRDGPTQRLPPLGVVSSPPAARRPRVDRLEQQHLARATACHGAPRPGRAAPGSRSRTTRSSGRSSVGQLGHACGPRARAPDPGVDQQARRVAGLDRRLRDQPPRAGRSPARRCASGQSRTGPAVPRYESPQRRGTAWVRSPSSDR